MAETSGLMKGKRGLVMGVANNRSIAWGIAKACADAGAEIALTYQGDALKKRVEPLANELGALLDAGRGGLGVAEALVADDHAYENAMELIDREVVPRGIGDGVQGREPGLVVGAEDLAVFVDDQGRVVGLADGRWYFGAEDTGDARFAAAAGDCGVEFIELRGGAGRLGVADIDAIADGLGFGEADDLRFRGNGLVEKA